MSEGQPVLVLHSSVAIRWWLYHRPHASDATRFLFERVAYRRVRLLIVEGLRERVLDEVARDLADVALDPNIAGQLFDDILRQVDLLTGDPDILSMDFAPLARGAFALAAMREIGLYDAATVMLAQSTRQPILIADDVQYAIVRQVAADRPSLRVLWLPDYLANGD